MRVDINQFFDSFLYGQSFYTASHTQATHVGMDEQHVQEALEYDEWDKSAHDFVDQLIAEPEEDECINDSLTSIFKRQLTISSSNETLPKAVHNDSQESSPSYLTKKQMKAEEAFENKVVSKVSKKVEDTLINPKLPHVSRNVPLFQKNNGLNINATPFRPKGVSVSSPGPRKISAGKLKKDTSNVKGLRPEKPSLTFESTEVSQRNRDKESTSTIAKSDAFDAQKVLLQAYKKAQLEDIKVSLGTSPQISGEVQQKSIEQRPKVRVEFPQPRKRVIESPENATSKNQEANKKKTVSFAESLIEVKDAQLLETASLLQENTPKKTCHVIAELERALEDPTADRFIQLWDEELARQKKMLKSSPLIERVETNCSAAAFIKLWDAKISRLRNAVNSVRKERGIKIATRTIVYFRRLDLQVLWDVYRLALSYAARCGRTADERILDLPIDLLPDNYELPSESDEELQESVFDIRVESK